MTSTRAIPAIAAFLAACGYVGDPLPPALNIPARIVDLRVVQVADRLEFAFTLPPMATDGVGIRHLADVELVAGAVAVAVERRDPGPATASQPVGAMVGQTLECKVRAKSMRGKWSEWSPSVDVLVAPPVSVPVPRVEDHPSGVRVSWSVPKGHSVRVLRDGEEAAVAAGGEWIDAVAKLGERHTYAVQAIHPGGARSEVSGELAFTPRDVFPPSTPTGLAGVAGIGAIELAWDRGSEPDLAGYRVYRSTGDEAARQVGETTPGTAYSDRAVKSGVAYRYAVSAVDRSGNESPRSAQVEVTAP